MSIYGVRKTNNIQWLIILDNVSACLCIFSVRLYEDNLEIHFGYLCA